MKKQLSTLLVLLSVFMVNKSMNAQDFCDSIQIDSVRIIGSNMHVFYSNQGNRSIVNPFVIAPIMSNTNYLSTSYNPAYANFFDPVNGSNNGVTDFSVPLTFTTPANFVPLNTQFTGSATLMDPNDTNIVCWMQFAFTYGTMSGNGIEENISDVIVTPLFPNPTESEINLSLTSVFENEVTISIVNMLGEEVKRKNVVVTPGVQQAIRFGLEELPSGVYNLMILTETGSKVLEFVKI